MADEISLTLRGFARKNNFKTTWPDLAVLIDMAAAPGGEFGLTWQVGTSEEDLTITDVATPGLALLMNVEDAGATKNVRWGPKSAGAMVEMGLLQPGEFAVFRWGQTGPPTLRAISTSGTTAILVRVLAN